MIYMSFKSTGCDLQGHITVHIMKGVGWRRHSLGEEGATRVVLMAAGRQLHCMDNPQESPWQRSG